MPNTISNPLPALLPRGKGHQFVIYGDSCSGVPGRRHEETTAAVNRVVARLDPAPEFIAYLGDEVIGLTTDESALRAQWAYWLEHEMAWLDQERIPIYHTTGNHTTYDEMSERLFREMLPHLPRNGPAGQEGLSYCVRHGDLLLVFVNTMWTGLGEGRVETAWLASVLERERHAGQILVFGHHPVFPTNGFAGAYQRTIAPEDASPFWDLLVKHRVLAYASSHMLAFDVQVHGGVLQIMTAGSGTRHRMPEGIEYLHALQAALDETGLRYQVLDDAGAIREWLVWPPQSAGSPWQTLPNVTAPPTVFTPTASEAALITWSLSGVCPAEGGAAQTLVSGWNPGHALPPLWIGLIGPEMRLGVLLAPEAGRSPHLWHGPAIGPRRRFNLEVAMHTGMGPGGLLWRRDRQAPWQSLEGASAWGVERLPPISRWSVGHDKGAPADRPFRGDGLQVTWRRDAQRLLLADPGTMNE